MKPTALLFSRYRAFKDEVRLSFAPLTLIIGKNGGGKSVLTRLPLIIAGGLSSQAEAPIDLYAGNVRHAARFEDLVFQRSAQPFMLGAEISEDADRFEFRATLRHAVETHSLAFDAFNLTKNGDALLSLKVASPEDIGQPDASFILEHAGQTKAVRGVNFVGLFPDSISGEGVASDLLVDVRRKFERAFLAPAYLGPFRSEQGSTGRVPRQGVRSLGPKGEGALDVLGDNALRSDGSLMRAVESWFETAMGGNRVLLEGGGGIPRLLVRDAARNLDVELAETGAGFAQVLPIVVQVLANDQGQLTNSLSIVEQPELHLHPGAHGFVADLFIQSIRAGADTRYLCETHSEQFITRIRRRIAEGEVSPESVQILSIGHQSTVDAQVEPLRVINVDKFGNVDSWPVGVFDEAFDDLVLLREAATKQEVADLERGG